MARRDTRRPRRRREREEYDSYYDRRRPRQRRGGCLAPVRRFFRNVLIVLLTAIGAIVFFIVVLLITFHFAQFIQIMVYVFWIAIGLLAIWIIYLVVHMISSISERMSQASERKARTKIVQRRADIERQRVHQAELQVERQEAKIEREAYQFYEQRQRPYYQNPRRTRNFREEEEIYEEQRLPRRTRNFREEEEQVRLANEAISEQKKPPTMPHLLQLLGKSITLGQKDMLYGFEMEQGNITAVRSGWPGTAIIAGKSGSGKTRRVIGMIIQAILSGMKITICDPHAYKPDGLIKVLAPFSPWLTFARSDAEIIAAAKEHIAEFESRLSSSGSIHGEGLTPRLIIFDEFPALMTSDSIENEDKKAIAKSVRKSATEYRGVFGSAWIIGQEFTEDAIFDTAIRKGAHAVLCHQLSDEYVKFLFPRDSQTQRLVQQIERRECIYKDQDNHTKRISTPTVTDEEIPDIVDYLARVLPRTTSAHTATLHNRQTEPAAQPSRIYGSPAAKQRQQQQIILADPQPVPPRPTTVPIPKRPRLPEPPQGPPITQPKQQRRTVQLPPDQHAVSAVWGEPILPQHPRVTQAPQQVIPSRRLVAPLTTEDLAQMQKKPTPTTDALDDLDALAALRDQRQPKKK